MQRKDTTPRNREEKMVQKKSSRGQSKKGLWVRYTRAQWNSYNPSSLRNVSGGPKMNKNGKRGGAVSGASFLTWFMVLALLGVWSSVAVVYFDLVDYQGVLVAVVYFDLVDYQGVLAKAKNLRFNISEILQGKLSMYDADGDGDFDVEDAKVLLGLTRDGNTERSESLEEVLDILAEEGSDWFQGFFTFLYDVMSPFETLEDEESEAATDDVSGTSQTEGVQGQKTCVILGLQNQ
ncbi:aspartate beta-hydroxylase [Silurus asotus]|uniref:Aspartate beta-hydroxylase n=1 Tax=Silurus asotus TaxID=30991 RepID=A0AAD5A849_SILAS|nr:aspartate beta-hydroxylase [Silurus asotus]